MPISGLAISGGNVFVGHRGASEAHDTTGCPEQGYSKTRI